MKIHVKDSKDQAIVIDDLSGSTRVEELIEKVIEKGGITTGNITLIYNTEIFEKDNVLDDYYVENNCTIIYIGEFKGGAKNK